MNNNIMKFGYEDTDKKIIINLYGLDFEIKNINEEEIKEIEKVGNNTNDIEREIDRILGEGSVEKINNKRIADGHDKMDLQVEMAVFSCIFQAFAKSMSSSILGGINSTLEEINNKSENFNRYERRNYKNNFRGNNRYRRY